MSTSTMLQQARIIMALQADRTPLHLAALQGHSTLASLLIGRGAEVDAKDENLMTPLHKAAIKVVCILLKHSPIETF